MYEYNDVGKMRRGTRERGQKGVILGACDAQPTCKNFFFSETKDKEERWKNGMKTPFLYSNP